MKQAGSSSIQVSGVVLPAIGVKPVVIQLMLLAAASFVLPAAAHATGLPVRYLLPMHWPVILAGLCYGWRSGAAMGIAAPFVSFMVSGMPPPHILPAMTVELAVYGFMAGFARQHLRFGWFSSSAMSLVSGRLVFLGFVFAVGAVAVPFGDYLLTAMVPGIPAAIVQLIVLSMAARWWVERDNSGPLAEGQN